MIIISDVYLIKQAVKSTELVKVRRRTVWLCGVIPLLTWDEIRTD